MVGYVLLAIVTVLYAGYNIAMRFSGGAVPDTATTTILATICVQLAALATSGLFLGLLLLARGGQVFALSPGAYLWAALAGLCIGGAEIGYLYLFGGMGPTRPMPAAIVIPTVVTGTVLLSILVAHLFLDEALTATQLAGAALVAVGIVALFAGGRSA
ncbi:MAG: hypothetical protein R3D45_15740 [Rhizobiaceae bacterium]